MNMNMNMKLERPDLVKFLRTHFEKKGRWGSVAICSQALAGDTASIVIVDLYMQRNPVCFHCGAAVIDFPAIGKVVTRAEQRRYTNPAQ